MDLVKKIIFTIIVIIFPVAGLSVIGAQLNEITNAFANIDDVKSIGTIILTIVMLIFIVMPGWFMWKGTKLIPIITNIVVRIIMMVTFLLILPIVGGALSGLGLGVIGETILLIDVIGIIAFSLVGIWLK